MSEQAAVSDVVVLGFMSRRRAVMLQVGVDTDGVAQLRHVPIDEVDTSSMRADDRAQVEAWRRYWGRCDALRAPLHG